MNIILPILIALFVASLCTTGAYFLKFIEAKKLISDLQKENERLKAEIVGAKQDNLQLQSHVSQLQRPNVKSFAIPR